jgi:hypothetical protein
MRSLYKKTITHLGIFFGVLLGSILLVSTLVIFRPEWVIDTSTAQWAITRYASTYQPRWKMLHLRVHSLSFRNKEISFFAEDLCFKNSKKNITGCFEKLEMRLALRFSLTGLQLTQASRLILNGTMDVHNKTIAAQLHNLESNSDIQLSGTLKYSDSKNLKEIRFKSCAIPTPLRLFPFGNFKLGCDLQVSPEILAKWAVPAPLNNLHGSLHLDFSIPDIQSSDPAVHFNILSDLKDSLQTFQVAAEGDASATKISADIQLKKIVVQLPYLEVKQMPSLKIDKRIKTPEAFEQEKENLMNPSLSLKTERPLSFLYKFSIRTENPILLYSNLAKTPVPIRLQLLLESNRSPEGVLHVDQFKMQIFRQIATVDHLLIEKKGASKLDQLEGLIIYTTSGITINLILTGTATHPRMAFQSEPPLTQQQIVALLLFGKYPDNLDQDEFASTQTMTSALTSGAFGIASLYLFASTPIEHVGFDPVTQAYSVRIRIAKGMSVEVGSTANENERITFRKRLSPHWQISTELKHEVENQTNTISTFLEWFKRF